MTQAGLFILVASLLLGDVVAQDATKIDDPSIEGTWIVKESSKNGPIKLVKEHFGGRSTVTAFDSTNRVLSIPAGFVPLDCFTQRKRLR